MPRRRMVDPEIWFNEKVAKLPDAARLLFIGIFSNADDDGRLKASPKYLKAHIFPYDDDKDIKQIRQFRDQCAKLGLIQIYNVNGSEYLILPGWLEHQQIRKDRYKPSVLPNENGNVSQPTTNWQPDDNRVATKGDLSQYKSVKSNISQYNYNKDLPDFSKFKNNKKDLTDLMTTTLNDVVSAGGGTTHIAEVFNKCWMDLMGEKMPNRIFQGLWDRISKTPLEILAVAFCRGVMYEGGSHKSWKYFEKIIQEETAKC